MSKLIQNFLSVGGNFDLYTAHIIYASLLLNSPIVLAVADYDLNLEYPNIEWPLLNGSGHAVLLYGWEKPNFKVYDPNYPISGLNDIKTLEYSNLFFNTFYSDGVGYNFFYPYVNYQNEKMKEIYQKYSCPNNLPPSKTSSLRTNPEEPNTSDQNILFQWDNSTDSDFSDPNNDGFSQVSYCLVVKDAQDPDIYYYNNCEFSGYPGSSDPYFAITGYILSLSDYHIPPNTEVAWAVWASDECGDFSEVSASDWETLFISGIDSDNDGIFDDGNGSGLNGDNPCTDGETENCDDNCPNDENPDQADSDGDGIGDVCDESQQTEYRVMIQHYYPDNYFIAVSFSGNIKSADVIDGPYIGNTFPGHAYLTQRPSVGDEYRILLTYIDETTEEVIYEVDGINDNFAWITFPSDNETINTTTPTFSWSPAIGEVDQYFINIHDITGGKDEPVWVSPVPSTQTSCDYNFNGQAVTNLQQGNTYKIYLHAYNQNGNQATTVSTFTIQIDDFPVYFPDPNLEAVIRYKINKPSENIMLSDLLEITYLDAGSRNINSIDGIQYCKNLRELGLYYNNITDISPLSELEKLNRLNIGTNNISDISHLAGLNNLSTLEINNNEIIDISPLSSLTELHFLDHLQIS